MYGKLAVHRAGGVTGGRVDLGAEGLSGLGRIPFRNASDWGTDWTAGKRKEFAQSAGSGAMKFQLFQKSQNTDEKTLTQDAGKTVSLRVSTQGAGDPSGVSTQGAGMNPKRVATWQIDQMYSHLGDGSGLGTVIGGNGSAWQANWCRVASRPPQVRHCAPPDAKHGSPELHREYY